MPLPLIGMPVSPRLTVLTAAIRRDILSALAESDTVTMSSATAQVAASWSARRGRRGDSPSAVRTAAAIVFQVGADLVDDVATRPSAPRVLPKGPVRGLGEQPDLLGRRRALFRRTTREA